MGDCRSLRQPTVWAKINERFSLFHTPYTTIHASTLDSGSLQEHLLLFLN